MRDEDEDAYREFVTARLPHLRRVAYLVCGDWHLAEDAVATALTKLYVHWARVRQADRVEAYARTVVLRCVIDERRRPWASRERPREAQLLPELSAADRTAEVDDRIVLRRVLEQLPRGRRAVLVLRFYEGLSVEETAAALGCSTGNVKSQTARGLSMLRDMLPEEFVIQHGGAR
jgi:RNA polymerase sigma-70 factor (sigma-E family)